MDRDFTDYSSSIINGQLTSSTDTFGLVSDKGNRNIHKCIDWLLVLASEKRSYNPKYNSYYTWTANFITLTLPCKQFHTDKVLKKILLDKFLIYASRKFGVQNYLWRQEPQSAGNIHYHVCTDVFIPWQKLLNTWCSILRSAGYMDVYQNGDLSKIPNCTDIHSLKKIKNIGAYLAKYCGKSSTGISILLSKGNTKNPIKAPLQRQIYYSSKTKTYSSSYSFSAKKFYRQTYGRLWGCSQLLSRVKEMRFMASDEQEREICRAVKAKKIIRQEYDYCDVFRLHISTMIDVGLNSIFDRCISYIKDLVPPDYVFN
jgi:predicted transcriptional regulator